MSIEIILFGVVALVLVLDFALRGLKKKTTQDDIQRIGKEKSKEILNLGYFKKRPKNIVVFIMSVLFCKLLSHYFLYPEYYGPRRKWGVGWVDSQKKSIGYHIDNLFVHDVWLFIPTILFLGLFIWYFNDKIKAR